MLLIDMCCFIGAGSLGNAENDRNVGNLKLESLYVRPYGKN